MAERYSEWKSEEREETVDPANPPNAVVNPEVRSAAFWLYLGPIIALCVVLGIALLYWSNRGLAPNDDVTRTIGTAGDSATPGGGDPAPRPDGTRDELESRGAGRPIDLQDAEVLEARDGTFWIRDGGNRVAVMAPPQSPAVRAGTRVHVTGVMESDGQGGERIRATRVTVR